MTELANAKIFYKTGENAAAVFRIKYQKNTRGDLDIKGFAETVRDAAIALIALKVFKMDEFVNEEFKDIVYGIHKSDVYCIIEMHHIRVQLRLNEEREHEICVKSVN
jgi:hypothetical protein